MQDRPAYCEDCGQPTAMRQGEEECVNQECNPSLPEPKQSVRTAGWYAYTFANEKGLMPNGQMFTLEELFQQAMDQAAQETKDRWKGIADGKQDVINQLEAAAQPHKERVAALEQELKLLKDQFEFYTNCALATMEGVPSSWSKYQVGRLKSIADKMVEDCRRFNVTANSSRVARALTADTEKGAG